MRKRTLWAALAVAAISTAAWAFPWDIDLYDSPAKKPYSWKMRPMPAIQPAPRARRCRTPTRWTKRC